MTKKKVEYPEVEASFFSDEDSAVTEVPVGDVATPISEAEAMEMPAAEVEVVVPEETPEVKVLKSERYDIVARDDGYYNIYDLKGTLLLVGASYETAQKYVYKTE